MPSMPWDPQTAAVVAVFAAVYLGMILGGWPGLRLDRTGVALLGAIAIVALGELSVADAAQGIHLPTILLLFSFMVISAQMRLGGFYGAVTRRIAALPLGPGGLLGVVIGVSAALSAVFSNDIVCLAMAPVLAQACRARRLDPIPFLLALACASNIGSAATLIGNPQNMLIGEVLRLPFAAYVRDALPPVLLSLAVLWVWLLRDLRRPTASVVGGQAVPMQRGPTPSEPPTPPVPGDEPPVLDRWQTAKGLAVAGTLMVVFLFTDVPRDVAALVGAGVLLLSQRFHSSQVMGLIDWELLVLFMGLFVVNHALQHTGVTAQAVAWCQAQGLALAEPVALFIATLGLSNLVSNVPAVMLLLPVVQDAGQDTATAGLTLALVSTLAGNLLLVGSIANLIVVDAARRQGVPIDWRRHARTGVPVTLLTLLICAAWLALRTAPGPAV